MEALVWKGIGVVQLEDGVRAPTISEREVLVRVQAAGICTTDIHMIEGKLDFAKPPWILGHEIAGVVERVGAEVRGWTPGDRVAVDPVVGCGQCGVCRIGKKYLCASGGELGTTYENGGYGQFVAVGPDNLYRLPHDLSYAEGAMMEPLNCTMGAVHRTGSMAGARVAVFGPGPAGLLFIQLAKVYGAASVTLVGLDDERLQLGERLGADRTVNIRQAAEREAFHQQQYDVVIEASGSIAAVRDGMERVCRGGTMVMYGLNGSDQPSIQSDQIVGKDLTIVTCVSAPLLWEQGIRLTQTGRINVKDIVTHHVPFAQAEDTLKAILAGRFDGVKAVIEYDA